jgi:DNA-directed RNA polymerase subunit RPC12/RpoP
MDNMKIYEAGRAVPPEAQKSFNNGKFSGTDINPMWRIKKMTELFGPCGIGWYYEVLSERCEEHGDNDTIAIVDLNLYIKVDGEWSKPIYGTGGNVIKRMNKYQKIDVSDEGYKMALTDALSVACKALGIGADIYFGKDKTKYTTPPEPPEKPALNLAGEKIYKCEECGMQLGPVLKNGRTISVEDQLRVMTNYTQKIVCPACLKKIVDALKEGA